MEGSLLHLTTFPIPNSRMQPTQGLNPPWVKTQHFHSQHVFHHPFLCSVTPTLLMICKQPQFRSSKANGEKTSMCMLCADLFRCTWCSVYYVQQNYAADGWHSTHFRLFYNCSEQSLPLNTWGCSFNLKKYFLAIANLKYCLRYINWMADQSIDQQSPGDYLYFPGLIWDNKW